MRLYSLTSAPASRLQSPHSRLPFSPLPVFGSLQLTDYALQRVEELRAQGKTATGAKYGSLARHLLCFLDGAPWPLASTDGDIILRFSLYLLGTGMSRNTLSSYMRPLAALLRRAGAAGMLEYDPGWFGGVYRGVDKTPKRAIGAADLRRIYALDLDTFPSLRLARDLFMFSFHAMGMPFVDVARLKPSDLLGDMLAYRRSKTGQTLAVPLNGQAKSIIRRYGDGDGKFLFPVMERGTGYGSALRMHNRRLVKIGEMAGVGVRLSSYIARHTWASLARDSGVDLAVISAALGHTTLTTTQIYLSQINTSALCAAVDRVSALLE